MYKNKQLLDEDLMISAGIINVEISVIGRSRRLKFEVFTDSAKLFVPNGYQGIIYTVFT